MFVLYENELGVVLLVFLGLHVWSGEKPETCYFCPSEQFLPKQE